MPQVLLLAHGADPKLREMDGISALSCAMNNGDHLVEVIGGAAAIRAHYLASGSAEWPIPAPAAPPAAEEQLAAEEEECGCCVGVEHRPMNFGKPRPDFAARMSRVRDEFLAISVAGGRFQDPTKSANFNAKTVYSQGIKFEVPDPPTGEDVRNADKPGDPGRKRDPAAYARYIRERANFLGMSEAMFVQTDKQKLRNMTLSGESSHQRNLSGSR